VVVAMAFTKTKPKTRRHKKDNNFLERKNKAPALCLLHFDMGEMKDLLDLYLECG